MSNPQYLAWGDVPAGAHVRTRRGGSWFLVRSAAYTPEGLVSVALTSLDGQDFPPRDVESELPVEVTALPATMVPDFGGPTEYVGLPLEIIAEVASRLSRARGAVRVVVEESGQHGDRTD